MPDDNNEKWSLVGSEIPCAEPDCGSPALTTCRFCWKHLPEDQKTGFKDKIEKLAEERKGDLQKFILRGANLKGADFFISVNLQGADISGAKLQKAYLVNAKLQSAWLTGAKLQKANLSYAKLQCANLTGAKLQGADLTHANFQDANLTGIEYDPKTTSFIGTDIRNIDWSKIPHLERRIKDQQWLHDFESRSEESRKLRVLGFLWRLTCDYGRSFWRWMAWSLGLAVLFGFLYADYGWYNWFSRWPALSGLLKTINPSIHVNPQGAVNHFTPYYYSIVTFTTLGFGDVIPANYSAQIIITIEVLLGYFMLGGLISILANYLARRS